jgi:hypothetical protein
MSVERTAWTMAKTTSKRPHDSNRCKLVIDVLFDIQKPCQRMCSFVIHRENSPYDSMLLAAWSLHDTRRPGSWPRLNDSSLSRQRCQPTSNQRLLDIPLHIPEPLSMTRAAISSSSAMVSVCFGRVVVCCEYSLPWDHSCEGEYQKRVEVYVTQCDVENAYLRTTFQKIHGEPHDSLSHER